MSVYVPFDEQRKEDASFTLQTMGIQLCINVGIATLAIAGFNFLRPKFKLVYEPKFKFAAKKCQAFEIKSKGWFSWVKPVITIENKVLREQIGCDAYLYVRFVCLLKYLLLVMSIIGVGILIPINIAATQATGDWPPAFGSIKILSIAGINMENGKLRVDPNTDWYWSSFAATWVFSLLVVYFMHCVSDDYVKTRQYFFQQSEELVHMRSVIVNDVPESERTSEKLTKWVLDGIGSSTENIKGSVIGRDNLELCKLIKEHEAAVKKLEVVMASYLDGKDPNTKKRPIKRVGGFLCFGGREIDAIEYYTEEVAKLKEKIKILREYPSTKNASYGWITFDCIGHAQRFVAEYYKEKPIRESPAPSDLVWHNLHVDKKDRTIKRWGGRVIYLVFTFACMVLVSAVSTGSNVTNFIQLFPGSQPFIDNNPVIIGFVQAYFTPIVMSIFFYLLPIFFRFLAEKQGYRTQTTLDHQLMTKLYVFFVFSNLLLFTVTFILIDIFGQLHAGSLPSSESISEYIMQFAKNIAEVSTFWINFVCLNSLTLTMDLAMVWSMITIVINKTFKRPAPHKVQEMTQPPPFDFPQKYNLLLFLFTIALVYSAISPLILPFALVYFSVAEIVHKYKLMYICATKIESGGQAWLILYRMVTASVLFFQLIMITILWFKGGLVQVYCLIPLPILTLVYLYVYYKGLLIKGTYLDYIGADGAPSPRYFHEDSTNALQTEFQDPAFHSKLPIPTIYDDVKHMIPKVYKNHSVTVGEKQEFNGEAHDKDVEKGEKHHKNCLSVTCKIVVNVEFATVAENEILGIDSNSHKNEGDQNSTISGSSELLPKYSFLNQLYGQSDAEMPLLYSNDKQSPPSFTSKQPDKKFQPPMQHEQYITSEYTKMETSFNKDNLATNKAEIQQKEQGLDNEIIQAASLLDSASERRQTTPPPAMTFGVPTMAFDTPTMAFGAPTMSFGAPIMTLHQPTTDIHGPTDQPSSEAMVLSDMEENAEPIQVTEFHQQLSVSLHGTSSIRRSRSIKRSPVSSRRQGIENELTPENSFGDML